MQQDSLGILTIENMKIAINSKGDDLASVKDIEKIGYQDADIIVCSCRSKGKSSKYIDKKFNQYTGYVTYYMYMGERITNENKDTLNFFITRLKALLIGLPKKS